MYFLRCFIILLSLKLCFTFLYPIEERLPLKGHRPTPDSVWPLPQKWNRSSQLLSLDPKVFLFDSNFKTCIVINNAMKRYRDIIFIDQKQAQPNSLPKLRSLFIEVKLNNSCGYPKHNEDESYEIIISSNDGVGKLNAKTVWGALRGLETFSQLVYLNQTNKTFLINATHIQDWPRYSFRGMHLDTARHFIPVKIILANLDAMAYNKFNVFHWHIVDDQSFPFQSKEYPSLWMKGAYSMKHIYSYEDINKIIEYARMRGIRVIPEVDTPGHTQGIGKAYPNLLTSCYGEGPNKPDTPNYPHHPARDILDPMKNETYSFMKKLYAEFKRVFKDEFIHLGMDEVYYACWKSSPEILQFMINHNMTEINQVEQYYVRRTIENVRNLGYKYLIWQDPVDNRVKLADDSIVIVWKDKYLDSKMDYWQNYILRIAKEGYQMVLSACWYLNYIETPYPGRDWEKLYTCDPRHFNGSEKQKDQVVGGEVCMWTEFADGTNVLSRLWPRASSVAERLWSSASATTDIDTARFRLDHQRCRLLKRGIPAAPILNGYCGDYEWEMEKHDLDLSDVGDRIRLRSDL